MPRPRDVLQRFRFAGAPGAAAAGGVPADRAAEAAAELGPVLALLDPAQDEVHRIRAEAEAQADRLRRDAAEEAARRVATAQAQARTWTSEAAAGAVARAAREAEEIRQAAQLEAAAMRERTARRLPAHVDRVVAEVLELARRDVR